MLCSKHQPNIHVLPEPHWHVEAFIPLVAAEMAFASCGLNLVSSPYTLVDGQPHTWGSSLLKEDRSSNGQEQKGKKSPRGRDSLREYMAMSFVNAVRSAIFFLSVTALICFVLDHLLWPAKYVCEVAKDCLHSLQALKLVTSRGMAGRKLLIVRPSEPLDMFIVLISV